MNKALIKTLFKMKLDVIDTIINCLPDTYSKVIHDSKNDLLTIIKTSIEENQQEVKNEDSDLRKIIIK